MNQNNNPFGGLTADGLEAPKDVLGGGFIVDSGVYAGEIKLAFAGVSKNGARSLTVHVQLDGGREFRETMYVTNRKGENFYERDGKKNPLPGFTTANDLALLATGQDLASQDVEEKVVKLYDFDQKAEVPTKVQALTSLHGKRVQLGILRQTVDKKKADGNGNYVPTGETRDENVIDKVFHAETGKTVSEYTRQLDDAEFLPQWKEKNSGVTRDKREDKSSQAGAPGAAAGTAGRSGGGTPSKSLFG